MSGDGAHSGAADPARPALHKPDLSIVAASKQPVADRSGLYSAGRGMLPVPAHRDQHRDHLRDQHRDRHPDDRRQPWFVGLPHGTAAAKTMAAWHGYPHQNAGHGYHPHQAAVHGPAHIYHPQHGGTLHQPTPHQLQVQLQLQLRSARAAPPPQPPADVAAYERAAGRAADIVATLGTALRASRAETAALDSACRAARAEAASLAEALGAARTEIARLRGKRKSGGAADDDDDDDDDNNNNNNDDNNNNNNNDDDDKGSPAAKRPRALEPEQSLSQRLEERKGASPAARTPDASGKAASPSPSAGSRASPSRRGQSRAHGTDANSSTLQQLRVSDPARLAGLVNAFAATLDTALRPARGGWLRLQPVLDAWQKWVERRHPRGAARHNARAVRGILPALCSGSPTAPLPMLGGVKLRLIHVVSTAVPGDPARFQLRL
jgi:hypothetical protein